MTFPLAHWSTRLINVPQVDEFALSSHCKLFNALPFYLKAFEAGVDLAVIKAGYLVAGFARTVPDVDFAHDTTCCDQVIGLVAKLALHEILVKVLCSHNLDISFAIDMPNACDHIRRAGK